MAPVSEWIAATAGLALNIACKPLAMENMELIDD